MWLWGAGLLVMLAHQSYCQAECPPGSLPIDSTTKMFNNIDYLGKGYDILTGNPRSTDSVDPGFRQRVFDLMDSPCGSYTADKRYVIPEHVDVINAESCSLSFDSRFASNNKEYLSELKRGIKIDTKASYGTAEAAFMGSSDYRSVKEEFENSNSAIIDSYAMCTVYKASLNSYDVPSIGYNFRLAVEDLPATFVDGTFDDKYVTFFNNFGTHVIQSMMMGASYGERYVLKETGGTSRFELQKDAALAASASACYAGACGSASVEASQSEQKKRIDEFRKKVASRKTISIGSKPPVPSTDSNSDENSRATSWSTQAFDNPVPVGYLEFLPITDVLVPKYIPDFDVALLAKKRAALVKALQAYCPVYAISAGIVSACTPSIITAQPVVTTPSGPATIYTRDDEVCFVAAAGTKAGLSTPGNDGESQFNKPAVAHKFVDMATKTGRKRKLLSEDMVFISSNGNWLWENHSWLYYRPDRQGWNAKFHWTVSKCTGGKGEEIKFGDCVYIKNSNNRRFIDNKGDKLRVKLLDAVNGDFPEWIVTKC